jgi:predicted MFS family arabinose efflux permease
MGAVLRDANHLRALLFIALIMLSSFMVIPYITLYSVANVGIRQDDLYLLYLAGGTATFFTSRLIGRLADRHGKVRVYRIVGLLALAPLLIQTHLVPIPLWLMIVVSTLFFILVPGRMVPAMAIVTSAAQPRLRGTFLSITGATQQLASGIAAWVGGLIIAQDAAGHIVRYDIVGWLATAVALLAIALAGRIRVQA